MHPTVSSPESIPDYSRLTRQEVGLLLRLHEAGKTQVEIAHTLECSQSVVSRWLSELADTTELAKHRAKASAEKLVERVVKDADVDQSLEVLDRLEVLPKRQQASAAGSVNILIGMPGQPAGPDPLIAVHHNGAYQTQTNSASLTGQALPAPCRGANEAKAEGETDAG